MGLPPQVRGKGGDKDGADPVERCGRSTGSLDDVAHSPTAPRGFSVCLDYCLALDLDRDSHGENMGAGGGSEDEVERSADGGGKSQSRGESKEQPGLDGDLWNGDTGEDELLRLSHSRSVVPLVSCSSGIFSVSAVLSLPPLPLAPDRGSRPGK
ncbi:unnamed protein product, partial [Discosporangium mesarthrocarpum]